jgi:hypothetical protein
MVLLACIIAMLMVVIDAGILNLLVPAIQAEFNPPQSTISCFVLLWLGLKPQSQSHQ